MPAKNNSGKDDNLLKLDHQLCFALYVSSKEIIRRYKPFLDPLNLTYTGYICMLALWEEDDVTVKALGARLTLDSRTLTPLLKRLESLSYIVRTRGEEDKRTVRIRLTEAGKALREPASKIPGQFCAATSIDPERTRMLLDFLHRLSSHLFNHRAPSAGMLPEGE